MRRGRNRIYGGKVIENVCQAIARCIIGEQMLKIAKEYRVVLTVHDSIVCCVRDEEVKRHKSTLKNVCDGHPTGLMACRLIVSLGLVNLMETVSEH